MKSMFEMVLSKARNEADRDVLQRAAALTAAYREIAPGRAILSRQQEHQLHSRAAAIAAEGDAVAVLSRQRLPLDCMPQEQPQQKRPRSRTDRARKQLNNSKLKQHQMRIDQSRRDNALLIKLQQLDLEAELRQIADSYPNELFGPIEEAGHAAAAIAAGCDLKRANTNQLRFLEPKPGLDPVHAAAIAYAGPLAAAAWELIVSRYVIDQRDLSLPDDCPRDVPCSEADAAIINATHHGQIRYGYNLAWQILNAGNNWQKICEAAVAIHRQNEISGYVLTMLLPDLNTKAIETYE